MVSYVWNAYLRVLSKYPMPTQIVQTGKTIPIIFLKQVLNCVFHLGTMMSLGDISAQKLVEKAETLDYKRTLRFTIIGSCIVVSVPFHCSK